MNKSNPIKKTLLVGIGNYGRADDALGWKFSDEFSSDERFDVEYRYQLQIEDAQLVSQYDRLIFVDASHEKYANGFSFQRCMPVLNSSYTTHKIAPETILWLAQDLYLANPESYLMAITGNSWKLKIGLSKAASQNLNNAIEHFGHWLEAKLELTVHEIN